MMCFGSKSRSTEPPPPKPATNFDYSAKTEAPKDTGGGAALQGQQTGKFGSELGTPTKNTLGG